MERIANTRRARSYAPAWLIAGVALVMLAGCSSSASTGGANSAPSIPKDFPSAIPLYEGPIISSAIEGPKRGRIWEVVVQVPSPEAMNTIWKQLDGAALKPAIVGKASQAGESILGKTSADIVEVVLAKRGGSWEATYIVTASTEYN